jgi:hypothetical protein
MTGIIIEGYRPEPHQNRIHQVIAKNKYTWIMGGFRSGKSRACYEEDIDICQKYPGMVVLITRKFHEDLEKTSKREFYEYCDPRLIADRRDGGDICVFRNGSQAIFRGLYARTSLQRSKLGSMNIGRAHVEEGSEIELKDFLDLQGRLSLTCVPENERKIYMTANPPTKDFWAFDLFEKNPRHGYGMIKVGTRENAKYLPATYISDLEESFKTQPGWLSRFFDGNWGFTPQGDPVYPEFSDIYLDESIEFNKGREVYRFWDFGWHHPAVLWCQVGPDQDPNILLEKMGTKIYLRDFAPDILRLTNDEFPNAKIIDICDDAGKSMKDDGLPSIQVLESPPFNLRMRSRHSFVVEGLELVRSKMREMIGSGDKARPALRIKGSKCPILVEGFRGGYCRDGDDVIKDGYYEHLHDCLREGFINIFSSNSRESSQDFSHIKIAQPNYNFQSNISRIPAGVGQ